MKRKRNDYLEQHNGRESVSRFIHRLVGISHGNRESSSGIRWTSWYPIITVSAVEKVPLVSVTDGSSAVCSSGIARRACTVEFM